jgi:hypothetical protein
MRQPWAWRMRSRSRSRSKAALVGLVAVEFDDETLVAPQKVGLEPAAVEVEVGVDLGPGQAVRIEQGEKAVFELAAGEGPVDDVQASAPHAPVDCICPEAQGDELRSRHYAVLAVREHRDRRFHTARVQFTAYIAVNRTLVGHGPIVAALMCRRARGT